jgi:hypothetical protein
VGYYDFICSASCGKCHTEYFWTRCTPDTPRSLNCKKCWAQNTFTPPEPWPSVPRDIYIGHDCYHQLRLLAIPLQTPNTQWVPPYSTRSFITQVAQQVRGCTYSIEFAGEIMGEPEFIDLCTDDHCPYAGPSPCHMLAGWTKDAITCALWEQIAALCQTEDERKFLHAYIQLVKHRQFPMLIPQARIGITQRRRPDFVVFVPLQHWKYRWYAIEFDGNHPWGKGQSDKERNDYLNLHGYEVISVTTNKFYKEVRNLVERIDHEMKIAAHDPLDVAIRLKVKETIVPEDDIPF